MPETKEIEAKFWKALRSDMTMMLGIDGVEDGHARPMTAQIDDQGEAKDEHRGPIWFFCANDNDLIDLLNRGGRAIAHFSSKGHEVFATLHGTLSLDIDRAVIERLWNPYIAAWFEGGKDDPKLALLRLDPERAQIWLDEKSLFAGVKLMLGADPKADYKDKVAEVTLG